MHSFDRRADQIADPLAHFARGLVGKGHAQDLARPGEPRPDEMGQSRGERRGLAGTRARQHQHRTLGGEHRFLLRRIQPIQPLWRIFESLRGLGGDVGHS